MPPQDLDDRYLSGIWYDTMSGDFCKFRRGENHVELLNPETSDVYHEILYEDWQFEQEDYYRVPDDAIEDPVAYMEDILADFDNPHFDVGYLFANKNTKLVETDDHNWHI